MPSNEAIAEEVNRRANLLTRLRDSVDQVLIELRSVRTELQDRPTRAETTQRRRGVTALLLLAIVIAFFSQDVHVETCGPGARTEPVVESFLAQTAHGAQADIKELQRVANRPLPAYCDVIVPIHAHAPDGYPTIGNVLGGLLYLLLAVGFYIWYRWPERWSRKKQRTRAGGTAPSDPVNGITTTEVKIEAQTVVIEHRDGDGPVAGVR